MKSNLNFILTVLLCISGYYAYKAFSTRPKAVVAMELQNPDSTKVTVPRAEPTIYVVWTTWCPACRSMLTQPFLQDPAIQSKIVLINDGEEKDLVLTALKERAYPFKTLLDPHRTFAKTVKLTAYPSFYIQNRNGKISHYEFGMVFRPDEVVKEWQTKLYAD